MIITTISDEYCNDNFAGCVKANMPNAWHRRLDISFDLLNDAIYTGIGT